VVTRKKISRMNEISAVEDWLSPGTFLLPFAITLSKLQVYFLALKIPSIESTVHRIETTTSP
jgi:hypothetical protein